MITWEGCLLEVADRLGDAISIHMDLALGPVGLHLCICASPHSRVLQLHETRHMAFVRI
jgi:hypothetical protein